MNDIHIIKLAVGIQDIQHLYEVQRRQEIDYYGARAVPCWTRFMPKRADEILKHEGSIYRVVKNRIVCRHRILGFEMVEMQEKGKMCMIMQDAEMMETVHMPRRAFQGWRYLEGKDAPPDRGVYSGESRDEIPEELEAELRDAGIL